MISRLTANGKYKLRFDLQSSSTGKWYYAEYSTFRVLSEARNYKLQVAGFSGNVGSDSFKHHNGMMFSTYDRDNDPWYTGNCAANRGGGFWYKRCDFCALNSDVTHLFYWFYLPGGYKMPGWKLQTSRMWLKCK